MLTWLEIKVLDSFLLLLIAHVLYTPGTTAQSDRLHWDVRVQSCYCLDFPPLHLHTFYFLQLVYSSCFKRQLQCHLVKRSQISRQNQSLYLQSIWGTFVGLYTCGYVSICQPLCRSYLFTHLSPGMDSVFLRGHDKDVLSALRNTRYVIGLSACSSFIHIQTL